MERYRRTTRNVNKKDKVEYKVKFARQAMVCGVIILVVSLISILKTDTAEKVSSRIGSTLSYTVDYKETVKDIINKINEFTKGAKNDTENTVKTD
ncbi:MAG: hypothetical protein UH854_05460 [Clostridia bacterium]|nr:hypothetical protein [Clostridia bacterium]